MLRRGLAGCPSFGNHQPDHGGGVGGKGQGTAAGLGLCFFAVENSHGHRDPAILRLAAAIDCATDTLPTMQKRVPAAWLKVFDRLRALTRVDATAAEAADDGSASSPSPPRPTLPFTELLESARACGLPHRQFKLEHECRVMLRFFHSLGAVLWFDDLRETVILDPQ